MIKTWIAEFHHILGREVPDYGDPKAVQHAYDSLLDRLSGLESIGFEGVFFAEHHFLSALNPNPNLMIAALAQRTSTLRMGVMGNVLAFHQPWRLAEDLAMLDYLTHGRLEIGFATGLPPEFAFIGIPEHEIRPRYAEAMEILELAAAGPVVTYHGQYYDYDELPINPRPLHIDRRRTWVAIYSPASAASAARHNHKICTAYQTVDKAALAFDAYRGAAADAGIAVGPDDLALRRTITLADTDLDAESLQTELLDKAIARTAATFEPVTRRAASAHPPVDEGVRQTGIRDVHTTSEPRSDAPPTGAPDKSTFADEFLIGSPATVAEKIIDQCRRTGAGNLLAVHSDAHTEEELHNTYQLWAAVHTVLAKADVRTTTG